GPAAVFGPPLAVRGASPFTPRLFMIASVVLYSLIRLRRSCSCFSASLRRSRPTVAGDVAARPALALLVSGARTLASARACANVTGPAAAPDFGERYGFREGDVLGRA